MAEGVGELRSSYQDGGPYYLAVSGEISVFVYGVFCFVMIYTLFSGWGVKERLRAPALKAQVVLSLTNRRCNKQQGEILERVEHCVVKWMR